MATEQTNISENDEISVKELILSIREGAFFLWSKWLVLLIAGIVGGVLGLWYSFAKTPVFTATTSFVLEGSESRSGLGRLSGMAAIAGIDLSVGGGGLFQDGNILELYKSRRMLEQTLLSKVHPDSNQLLVERYIAYNGIKDGWGEQPDLLALDFKENPASLDSHTLRLRDSVLSRFVNTIRDGLLTVDKPDKDLSIIKVDVTSTDEVFSKAFNETLVGRVNDFYIETKTKRSAEYIAILEAKVDSVRDVMSRAIYSAARVSDVTPNLNPTRQVQRVGPAQEAQFSAETNKAMLAQLLQNLEITKMSLLQEQPLIQLVDQPVYPLPVNQLGKVKGVVIGGFLAGFLTLLGLIVLRWYRQVMHADD